jgi:hypothetical protein
VKELGVCNPSPFYIFPAFGPKFRCLVNGQFSAAQEQIAWRENTHDSITGTQFKATMRFSYGAFSYTERHDDRP